MYDVTGNKAYQPGGSYHGMYSFDMPTDAFPAGDQKFEPHTVLGWSGVALYRFNMAPRETALPPMRPRGAVIR